MPSAVISSVGTVASGLIGAGADSKAAKNSINAANQSNQVATNVYDTNQSNLNPYINTGTSANNTLAGLLGTGGNTAASKDAFNQYLGSSNYNFTQQQGLKGVASQNAASYGSGGTAKALEGYASGLAGNTLNSYESMLSGLGGQGLNAASSLGSLGGQYAGQYSSNLMSGTAAQNAYNQAAAGQYQGIASGLTNAAGQASASGFGGLFGGSTSSYSTPSSTSYYNPSQSLDYSQALTSPDTSNVTNQFSALSNLGNLGSFY